jgi:hypothetical protein
VPDGRSLFVVFLHVNKGVSCGMFFLLLVILESFGFDPDIRIITCFLGSGARHGSSDATSQYLSMGSIAPSPRVSRLLLAHSSLMESSSADQSPIARHWPASSVIALGNSSDPSSLHQLRSARRRGHVYEWISHTDASEARSILCRPRRTSGLASGLVVILAFQMATSRCPS